MAPVALVGLVRGKGTHRAGEWEDAELLYRRVLSQGLGQAYQDCRAADAAIRN